MSEATDPGALRRFVAMSKSAALATIGPDGRPRVVPICFALDERPTRSPEEMILWTAVDEKPKRSTDPLRLARVRDIVERRNATVLVDRWDEDWTRLAWVRLDCRGEVVATLPRGDDEASQAERERVVAALRAKYPQYASQRLERRPLIRLTCSVGAVWGDLEAGRDLAAGWRPGAEREPDVEAM